MRVAVLIPLLLFCLPALAGDVVFYRCTDASGALTVQNMPCPKGMQQTTKVMQAVETPAFVPPPAQPAAPPAPTPAAGNAVMDRLYAAPEAAVPTNKAKPLAADPVPLPPLFQCTPRNADPYLSESATPPGRCVAMQVTGLDGNPRTGAGEACEVIRDTCSPVAEAKQCEVWRKRVSDAEIAARFTSSAQAEQRQREYERLQALLDASACVTQNP